MTIYLGENIKRLRHEKELTQEALAEFLGVTFQSVSKWERSESYPDITTLPAIALFFNVSVDDLLGVNKVHNEEKIKEYIKLYDTMKLSDLSLTLKKFRRALKEFPGDFRLSVRYMQLLHDEKSYIFTPEYEKVSKEINSIYESIQEYCTDDSIRMWSKRIMIEHMMLRYDTVSNKEGIYRSCEEYLHKAKEIADTLPAMSDSKELMALYLEEDACKKILEELVFLLQNELFSHCFNCSTEQRIKQYEHQQGLLELIYPDGDYGKNCFHRLYNYGHLGHLYHKAGNDEKAVQNLRAAAEYAKELDNSPDVSQQMMKFYNYGKIYRETNAREFMKIVITEHYKLSETFMETEEFKNIINILG